MNTQLSEALDGIETVKGAAQETNEITRFKVKAGRYAAAAVRQGKVEARFLPLLLLSLAFAAGLFQALLLYRQGTLNMGQVIGYFGLLLMLDFPTFTSLWAYSMIASGLAGARRILELMNRENNLDQNLAGLNGAMRGAIEFRNVTFHYESGEPSLENVSFHVQPGQTVAIVGQTGSSKTTLAKLINRTYDVTAGQVLVDGVDVRDWNLEALRRQISIIEQDIFLFSRSIAENIAFGKPGATEDEVHAAAEAAQADEFIREFTDGYQTVIGERGVTLSGGQRQRLALARAFLTDPRILILDDSTSAIDSATEDLIQRAIFAAAKGRTTFIITHRLSQIRWADLILVMRKGRLTAMRHPRRTDADLGSLPADLQGVGEIWDSSKDWTPKPTTANIATATCCAASSGISSPQRGRMLVVGVFTILISLASASSVCDHLLGNRPGASGPEPAEHFPGGGARLSARSVHLVGQLGRAAAGNRGDRGCAAQAGDGRVRIGGGTRSIFLR